jgi:hypothetical protein
MSQTARNARVAWCQEQQEIERDWKSVVFSDESWFILGRNTRWVWRLPGEDGPDACDAQKHHPEKLMIWGAIGYNFKSDLHFVPRNMNIDGNYYLENILLGGFIQQADAVYGEDWVLQQDNARPHIRCDVIESLNQLSVKILPLSI